MTSDIYRILNVGKRATAAEVRAAYLRLASEIHPDLNSQDAAAELRFKEIQKAYEILGNPRFRAEYDRNRPRRRARTIAARSASQSSHVATSARTANPWQQHGGATMGFDFFDRATAMRSRLHRFLLAASVCVFVVLVAIVGMERWSAHHNPLLVSSAASSDRGDDNATGDLSPDGDDAFDPLSRQPHDEGKLAMSGKVSPALLDPDPDMMTESPVAVENPAASDFTQLHSQQQIVVDLDELFGQHVTWPKPAAEYFTGTQPTKKADADGYAAISRHFGEARYVQAIKIGTESHDWTTAAESGGKADATHSQQQPYGGYLKGTFGQPLESLLSQQSLAAGYGNPWDQSWPIAIPTAAGERHQTSRFFAPFNAASSPFNAARSPFNGARSMSRTNAYSLHSRTVQTNSQPYAYGTVGNPSPNSGHFEGFGARLPNSHHWIRANNNGIGIGFLPAYRTPTLQSVLPAHGNSFTSPGRMAAGAASGSSFNW